ncbi:GTP-binding protein 2-like [Liolophura sinensis]|uniref:GTP-binding protein 2-like n=1 Tax=Liolophura sinensis TaxID=3198878 RepID=UPI0031583ED7
MHDRSSDQCIITQTFTMDHLLGIFDNGTDKTMPESLPPELEEGNVEYKLKLVNPSESRFEHLVTQMKWRLQEGHGEAIYEIGVEDNGLCVGLSESDLNASLTNLQKMAQRLGASLTVLRERSVEDEDCSYDRKALEILVRKVPDDQQFIDLRVAVLGNVDAGKSTLLGVLSQGQLDNGRGRARLNLFRHLHEIQSGRTSSISHEILGFNSKGEIVNYSESRSMEEICENSSKLVTLIDLAGHHKYLKTTILGLTGYSPDFAMLVVSANAGLAGTTKEHLGFALALKVPVIVVVTKIDQCKKVVVEKLISQLDKLLKSPGCSKIPVRVSDEDDAITAATNFASERICPVFTISSVSGKNLNLLTKFLNVVSPFKTQSERERSMQELTEYQVDEVYSVPGVGTVVGGTLHRGILSEEDKVLLGPTENGEFMKVNVRTMHRNRLPCRVIQPGQTATVSIPDCDRRTLRKGMMLLSPGSEPQCCIEFLADIYLLFHKKSLKQGFQTTVHIGSISQTATIVDMNKKSIKTNERAVVTFRLIKQPEYIRPGARLVFREGRTKGMGEVLQISPYGSRKAV